MAKVRIFGTRPAHATLGHQGQPWPLEPPSSSYLQDPNTPTPVEKDMVVSGVQVQHDQHLSFRPLINVEAMLLRSQSDKVSEDQDVVDRVSSIALRPLTHSNLASLNASHPSNLPFYQSIAIPTPVHLATRLAQLHSLQKAAPTPTSSDTHIPTEIELAGYAGLEDLPILRRAINHDEVNRIHSFYFRYNDHNCPAGVLLVDPLSRKDKFGEWDRNCWNDGHSAYLYVRKRGDIKWTRDYTAERGAMRQAVYLSRCEKGWMWEQQLGDMLDCRKNLNLWIQVRS